MTSHGTLVMVPGSLYKIRETINSKNLAMKQTYRKIHRIVLPVPFPLKTTNVYLVDEEPITLIDTGVKTEDSFQVLRDSLRGLGYGIEDIRKILITHGHLDHYGQAERISALSGAEVSIHAEEYRMIQSMAQFRRQVASVLIQHGAPEDSVDETIHYMESAQQWGDPLKDLQFIHEGDEICFENMVLRPIHCPGHSPGLLCFYLEGDGILVSGDHLLKEISPNPIINPLPNEAAPGNTSLKTYMNSIRKIEHLEVSLVLPGHGEPFLDFKATLEKILRHHEQRLALVLSVLSRGEMTAYDISKVLFPNTKSFEVFLGVSEVLGHLSILLEDEKVILRSRNGRHHYSINFNNQALI
jgi:glyoxylase-like metal-dependent hydrolase (beta-lactamase superfamily II)